MKLILKSIRLFILGVYTEYYRHKLDRLITKHSKLKNELSNRRLVHISNKTYSLYLRFKEHEEMFLHDSYMCRLAKRSV